MASDGSGLMVGRKQRSVQSDWIDVVLSLRADLNGTLARATALVHATCEQMSAAGWEGDAAYGWSGGKDSQVLRLVCDLVGIRRNVLGLADRSLEFPEFDAWACDRAGVDCTIVRRNVDLEWLRDHERFLFPTSGSLWGGLIQRPIQHRFAKASGIRTMVLGRRRDDGNWLRPDDRHEKDGVVYWTPLSHWTHADVLAVMIAYDLEFAPCYDWPRGFQVGTGPWPKRKCKTVAEAWEQTFAIDEGVVRRAAEVVPSAASWLNMRVNMQVRGVDAV